MKFTIRQARMFSGMTLREVADLIGVHFQTLRNWEIGKFEIPEEMKLKLEEIYKMKGKIK